MILFLIVFLAVLMLFIASLIVPRAPKRRSMIHLPNHPSINHIFISLNLPITCYQISTHRPPHSHQHTPATASTGAMNKTGTWSDKGMRWTNLNNWAYKLTLGPSILDRFLAWWPSLNAAGRRVNTEQAQSKREAVQIWSQVEINAAENHAEPSTKSCNRVWHIIIHSKRAGI